jgi:hypothetical protein
MKNTLCILVIILLASCSGSKQSENAPDYTVVCDSVERQMYDSAGNEHTYKVFECDTVKKPN